MRASDLILEHRLRTGVASMRVHGGWSRGMLVVCPAARATALVQTGPAGDVERCSRWPRRAACSTECAAQHHGAAQRSLLERVIEEWYAERPCALRPAVRAIHWTTARPP